MRFVLLLLGMAGFAFAQTAPLHGLNQIESLPIAYVNGTILIDAESGKTVSAMLVEKGRVKAIGNNISIPKYVRKIDLKGHYVYPGFIEPFSKIGIPKKVQQDSKNNPMPQIKQSGSAHWNAAVTPERSASALFSVEEKELRAWLKNGFTTLQVNGMDGLFAGSAAVVSARKGNNPQRILKADNMQFVSFSKGSSKQSAPSSLMGSIALIRQLFYDAQWYKKALAAYKINPKQKRPVANSALKALQKAINRKQTVLFNTNSYLDVLRAERIAQEFKLKAVYKTGTNAYAGLEALKKIKPNLIIQLNFPETPDVDNPDYASDFSLAQLRHWDQAPSNPHQLYKAQIPFAFTSNGLKKKEAFLTRVRTAVAYGLPVLEAIKALTLTPAQFLGIEHTTGSLKSGKLANFVVSDKPIFAENARIVKTVVEGQETVFSTPQKYDMRGVWNIKLPKGETIELNVAGAHGKEQAQIKLGATKWKVKSFSQKDEKLHFIILKDTLSLNAPLRFSGQMLNNRLIGQLVNAKGDMHYWQADLVKEHKHVIKEAEKKEKSVRKQPLSTPYYPSRAYGVKALPKQEKAVLISNATIWTAGSKGILQESDMLVVNGKIMAVGKNISAPKDAVLIDGSGLHITPGIIDEHTHIAVNGGVNEGSQAISAEVRIGDVLNPENIHIYRQLAGGVTTAQILHGSANPIGGQAQVIKLRWGSDAVGLKYRKALPSIKFALGENVKQANWGDKYRSRYPQTRMGVRELIWDGFARAKAYSEAFKTYNALSATAKKRTIPPRKDLELDALTEILEHKRIIHCHSYVQSEILMLMEVAEDFGFKVGTFTHVLEGYKVAEEMKQHGAMASTFADWWNYKFEVYEAIPFNTALMARAGVVTSVNSDDAEMARRLNQEAAKAIKYGGLTPEEAIKLVTINAAKQLKVDAYTGSLESGKEADFVIWNNDPLSIYARVLQTWIEGRKYFDIEQDKLTRKKIWNERTALINKASASKQKAPNQPTAKPSKKPKLEWHCDDMEQHNHAGGAH